MPRPTATATIDPIGARTSAPREHLLKLNLPLDRGEGSLADREHVQRLARRSLNAYAPTPGDRERRDVRDVTIRRKGKNGAVDNIVVGVEASVISAGRPPDAVIADLRAVLLDEGYQVVVRERRECTHGSCSTEAMVEWGETAVIPPRWFARDVCGKHDFKSCAKCRSVYLLTSSNAAGQAPSVHCEVCGQVLVEWGASKVWNAELVTRGA